MKEMLQDYFDTRIPITRDMRVKVQLCNQRVLILTAPLAINRNDKNTAFGGSVVSILTLAGWAITHTVLSRLQLHATTVVRRSKVDYIKPIDSEIMIISNMPSDHDIYRFKQDLMQRGKARWEIQARAECNQELAVDYSGVYISVLIPELIT
ncbi:YiiD C-terminal domain-containing protein [Thioflexithrix psekupsensis]|uniref:Thioesterase putative domain-containing protein n=1 Tax=Thioflexithrix psekupsensis TaxID=1570016 RepID=A0A251X5Q0_9GAMM|nr:YiiD C-terminal domain-containing protein [Thioflexithrix psekupsensis]OUD12257.1 hypothetical protein TPSD3_14145 [Thioflexithrix psekupsensis]